MGRDSYTFSCNEEFSISYEIQDSLSSCDMVNFFASKFGPHFQVSSRQPCVGDCNVKNLLKNLCYEYKVIEGFLAYG